MAPSKLSDADKQTILELYHLPEETTSTLAERYGVSNSTISRLLKSHLPEKEYAVLIQQKRVGEKGSVSEPVPEVAPPEPQAKQLPEPPELPKPVPEVVSPEPQAEEIPVAQPEPAPEAKPTPVRKIIPPIVRDQPMAESAVPPIDKTVIKKNSVDKPTTDRRRRSRNRTDDNQEAVAAQLPLLQGTELDPIAVAAPPSTGDPLEDPLDLMPAEEALVELPETAVVAGEDYDDEDDDIDEDDLDDDDLDDEEGGLGSWKLGKGETPNLQALQISPLTAAALPGLCYVVVERTSSELVTCPLRDFSALGTVPEEEVDARTLPIFDNHRVARRFSRRNQRVVKVPDGRMLQKTSPYLQAKGITRLLIDGHIYALGSEAPLAED